MPKSEESKHRLKSEDVLVMMEEYKALRAEILKRIEFRYQIINFVLIVSGTFLSVGSQPTISASVLLVYPLLAMFLTFGWVHNGVIIIQTGRYIQENIENRLPSLRWETDHFKKYPFKRFGRFSTSGLILTTQLLAIALASIKSQFTQMDIFLFAISILSIVSTGFALRFTSPLETRRIK